MSAKSDRSRIQIISQCLNHRNLESENSILQFKIFSHDLQSALDYEILVNIV